MNSRQSERSVPWTTRGRVEINISFHGSLFINGLWQRYISSSAWFFLLASHNAAAGQRRVFALPCVHPRAGRQCIALTKRKRVSCVVAVGETHRCLEQPDDH